MQCRKIVQKNIKTHTQAQSYPKSWQMHIHQELWVTMLQCQICVLSLNVHCGLVNFKKYTIENLLIRKIKITKLLLHQQKNLDYRCSSNLLKYIINSKHQQDPNNVLHFYYQRQNNKTKLLPHLQLLFTN